MCFDHQITKSSTGTDRIFYCLNQMRDMVLISWIDPSTSYPLRVKLNNQYVGMSISVWFGSSIQWENVILYIDRDGFLGWVAG